MKFFRFRKNPITPTLARQGEVALFVDDEGALKMVDTEGAVTDVGGAGGGSLPDGGTTGQVLAKQSNADGDADWATPQSPQTGQGIYLASKNVAQGATELLVWNPPSGDPLLNLSTQDEPTIIDAGIYAISVQLSADALSSGGSYLSRLRIFRDGNEVFAVYAGVKFGDANEVMSLGFTLECEAGDIVHLIGTNNDTAGTHLFQAPTCVVTRLT